MEVASIARKAPKKAAVRIATMASVRREPCSWGGRRDGTKMPTASIARKTKIENKRLLLMVGERL